MNDNALLIANILLKTKAVRLNVENYFTYSSGIKSPIYCDNRFLIGFPEARTSIIDAFTENEKIQEAEIIVGTATAGIPWASIIAHNLKKPLAYVRSEAKKHGTTKSVEGAIVKGKKVVIIEDLISTGGSSKKVLDHLLLEEAIATSVVAIFSYEFKEIEAIFGNIPFYTLSNFTTLLKVAEETKALSPEECKIASEWNKSPHTWKV